MNDTPATLLLGLSRRTVAAINVVAELATQAAPFPRSSDGLAASLGIPPDEVRDLLHDLNEAGIVALADSGSLALNRDPAELSLYEIALAVGESFQRQCKVSQHHNWDHCPMDEVAQQLERDIREFFSRKTLSALLAAAGGSA